MAEDGLGAVVERARAGDAEAFASLFGRFAGDVGRVCRRMLGSGPAAEDAAAEVFLRARRALDGYDVGRPFRTWLLAIASNHCIDQLRRRSTERRLFDERELDVHDLAHPGPSPLRRLAGAEERRRILAAIEALPEKYRVPIVLRYFNELGYDAIADVLGVKRAQVGTLLFRARRHLREHLGDGEGDA